MAPGRHYRAMLALHMLVLVLVCAAGCATQAGGQGAPEGEANRPEDHGAIRPDADLSHMASGMRFPIEVAGLLRVGMSRYDKRGDDVSVGYHHLDNTMALTATVYIFPADRYGGDIDVQFSEARDAVLRNRQGAELLAQGDMQLFQRGEYKTGRRAHFSVKDPSGQRPMMVSHLFLFRHGPWFIKYRATFPAEQHDVCDDALLRFMAALPWPEVAPGVLAERRATLAEPSPSALLGSVVADF